MGTQLPFPRLIDALARLAPNLEEPVVAQAGATGAGWDTLDVRASVRPDEFDALFSEARVVVGHAGIGTILSARRHRKPLIVLPRRHALGEHRNDHQLATARQVAGLDGIHVAWDTDALPPLLQASDLIPATDTPSTDHAALIDRLKRFIDG